MNYNFAFEFSWIIPVLPFISFLIVGLFIRPISNKWSGIVATVSIIISAVFAYMLAWKYFNLYPPGTQHPALIPVSFEWLRFAPGLSVISGVFVDPISILLMIVVTTVSALVHLYSIGYMHGEDGYGRYFAFLNLFTFSMLGLVVSPNIMQTFVFWELVGVSSFLLIGFYYQKPSAVAASKKAFIVTRFADLGFLIGIIILGYYGFKFFPELSGQINSSTPLQPFDFLYLTNPIVTQKLNSINMIIFGMPLLTLAMILVFMGAAGKSAMFPLHIWLPDAMEGPTPVSALIHAATMVVAGVYLVARLFPSFAISGDALLVVAYVGAFTAVFAAIIGCTQDDIKRVLAFSTLSQLGYMMFALGVATFANPLGFTASMFHLFTHAFFKALLFLGAGALIHAVHSNSIWDMGGLRKKMPITHITFLIACLAIAGVWPFAGFFSKDEILLSALENGYTGIFILGLLVAGLTSFYMFRIYFVSFWGKERSEKAHHAHEAPIIMWLPLAILAFFSAIAGFVPMNEFIGLKSDVIGATLHHGINWNVVLPASILCLLGISSAWFLYSGNDNKVKVIVKTISPVYKIIKNKFFIDEVYQFVTHKIIFNFVARPIAWFDRNVVDGGVNLSGWITRKSGLSLSFLQTGQVQTYAVSFLIGIIVLSFTLWTLIK